jgi:hypothetical protein
MGKESEEGGTAKMTAEVPKKEGQATKIKGLHRFVRMRKDQRTVDIEIRNSNDKYLGRLYIDIDRIELYLNNFDLIRAYPKGFNPKELEFQFVLKESK